tara:strand:+ start:15443 stop:16276 length:834 start_codon:yes stop_codon:yes gene_type:complete
MTYYYNYDEWEENLRPGDMLLFGGKDVASTCIKYFQNCHLKKDATLWTHAGLVCPHNVMNFKNKCRDKVYVLESLFAFDGIKNVETNGTNGLQIRDLREVVAHFLNNGGIIASFTLKNEIFEHTIVKERELSDEVLNNYKETHKYRHLIQAFWDLYKSSSYDFCNVSKSVGIILPCLSSGKKMKRLFCSEAVIRFYQVLGIINKDIDAELVSPQELGDWSNDLEGSSPFFPIPLVLSNNYDLPSVSTLTPSPKKFDFKNVRGNNHKNDDIIYKRFYI